RVRREPRRQDVDAASERARLREQGRPRLCHALQLRVALQRGRGALGWNGFLGAGFESMDFGDRHARYDVPDGDRLRAVAQHRRRFERGTPVDESAVEPAAEDHDSGVAAHRPLIVSIDDLQWADVDSLALLGDIMRPPNAPPMLLVATLRVGTERQLRG